MTKPQRVNLRNREYNKRYRSEMRTRMKNVLEAVDKEDYESAVTMLSDDAENPHPRPSRGFGTFCWLPESGELYGFFSSRFHFLLVLICSGVARKKTDRGDLSLLMRA